MPYCAYCGTPVAETSYTPCLACGNPSNGAPKAQLATGGTNAAMIAVIVVVGGFLLIAVAGIVAAIAVPNFVTALQRAKQKRTMADVRELGTAIEAYSADNSRLPSGSSLDELATQLSPKYIKVVPRKDGWGRDFRFEIDPETTTYVLASGGKDGVFERPSLRAYLDPKPGVTTNFDCDIVFANGEFVEYPEGVQH